MTHESAAGSTDQRNRDLTARPANIATLMHIPVIEAQSIGKSCVLSPSSRPDALIDNVDAHRVHRALGFVETERVVYFCKRLDPD